MSRRDPEDVAEDVEALDEGPDELYPTSARCPVCLGPAVVVDGRVSLQHGEGCSRRTRSVVCAAPSCVHAIEVSPAVLRVLRVRFPGGWRCGEHQGASRG